MQCKHFLPQYIYLIFHNFLQDLGLARLPFLLPQMLRPEG